MSIPAFSILDDRVAVVRGGPFVSSVLSRATAFLTQLHKQLPQHADLVQTLLSICQAQHAEALSAVPMPALADVEKYLARPLVVHVEGWFGEERPKWEGQDAAPNDIYFNDALLEAYALAVANTEGAMQLDVTALLFTVAFLREWVGGLTQALFGAKIDTAGQAVEESLLGGRPLLQRSEQDAERFDRGLWLLESVDGGVHEIPELSLYHWAAQVNAAIAQAAPIPPFPRHDLVPASPDVPPQHSRDHASVLVTYCPIIIRAASRALVGEGAGWRILGLERLTGGSEEMRALHPKRRY
ncbi:hypothetical protein JCM10213_000205 [Rhodosporidiobolus nylandii]